MNWIDLLKAAVEKRGQSSVSKELDLSRTTISLVLKGTYNAGTTRIEKKVLSVYGKTICPFLQRILDAPDCRWYRERPIPMNHHQEIEHWRACQKCDAQIYPSDPSEDEE